MEIMLKLTVGSGVSALAIEQFFTWAQRIEQGSDAPAPSAVVTQIMPSPMPTQSVPEWVKVTAEPVVQADETEDEPETHEAPAAQTAAEQPVKRRPGRPRKNPETAPAGMTAQPALAPAPVAAAEPPVPAAPVVITGPSAAQAQATLGMMAEPPAPVAAILATIEPTASGVAIPPEAPAAPAATPVAVPGVAIPPGAPPLAETAIPAAMPAVPSSALEIHDGVPTLDQWRALTVKCVSLDPALPFRTLKAFGYTQFASVPPEQRSALMDALEAALDAAKTAKAA